VRRFAPTPPTPEPTAWVVRHRPPPGGGRWRVVGEAATYAEALALTRGAGNWWVSPRVDEPAGGPKPTEKPEEVPAAETTPSLFS
jgi:hypothetical protein